MPLFNGMLRGGKYSSLRKPNLIMIITRGKLIVDLTSSDSDSVHTLIFQLFFSTANSVTFGTKAEYVCLLFDHAICIDL